MTSTLLLLLLNFSFLYFYAVALTFADIKNQINTVLTRIEASFESLQIKVSSKVQRDVRATILTGEYITRKVTKNSQILIGGISDLSRPLLALPSAIKDISELASRDDSGVTIRQALELVRAGINPLQSPPELLGTFKATNTRDRVLQKPKRVKETPVALDILKASMTLPATLRYDFQRRQQGRSKFANSLKSLPALPEGKPVQSEAVGSAALPSTVETRLKTLTLQLSSDLAEKVVLELQWTKKTLETALGDCYAEKGDLEARIDRSEALLLQSDDVVTIKGLEHEEGGGSNDVIDDVGVDDASPSTPAVSEVAEWRAELSGLETTVTRISEQVASLTGILENLPPTWREDVEADSGGLLTREVWWLAIKNGHNVLRYVLDTATPAGVLDGEARGRMQEIMLTLSSHVPDSSAAASTGEAAFAFTDAAITPAERSDDLDVPVLEARVVSASTTVQPVEVSEDLGLETPAATQDTELRLVVETTATVSDVTPPEQAVSVFLVTVIDAFLFLAEKLLDVLLPLLFGGGALMLERAMDALAPATASVKGFSLDRRLGKEANSTTARRPSTSRSPSDWALLPALSSRRSGKASA